MATPDSSRRLRAAVDAVATPRHEIAFRVLDLYRIHSHRGRWCRRSRLRATELSAALDEILAQLGSANQEPDPGPARHDDAERDA